MVDPYILQIILIRSYFAEILLCKFSVLSLFSPTPVPYHPDNYKSTLANEPKQRFSFLVFHF